MKLVLIFVAALGTNCQCKTAFMENIPNCRDFSCFGHPSTDKDNVSKFGDDYENADGVWKQYCELDSDGDTYTNGQELGDPNCNWERGNASPGPYLSDPGDRNSVPPPNSNITPVPTTTEANSPDTENGDDGQNEVGSINGIAVGFGLLGAGCLLLVGVSKYRTVLKERY